MREFVRTVQGAGWVHRTLIEPSRSLIVLQKDATLRAADRGETLLSAGTMLRRDDRLTEQTSKKPIAEQRTHQILEEGVHAAIRQCLHVQDFECLDGEEMLTSADQIGGIADKLYSVGQLELPFHEQLAKDLMICREQRFNERKTNAKKREVREHLDTASAQRTRKGRMKAMPASAATRASKRDVLRRLQETVGIHAAFGRNGIAAHRLLEEISGSLDGAWKIVQPDAGMATYVIARAMNAPTRDRTTIRLASKVVERLIGELDGVIVLPYLPLAQATMEAARKLHWSIDNCRRKRVDECLDHVRYLLRRMRMLRYLEEELIFPISFPADDGTIAPRARHTFTQGFGRALARVIDFKDTDFDPVLRTLVREYLEAVNTNAANRDYASAREELKRLTHELRVQPVAAVRKAA